MRARPLTVLAAVAVVTLALAGCDEALAQVQPKASASPVHGAPARKSLPQPETFQLLLDTVPMAGKGFGSLPARIQRAIAEASGAGAALSDGHLFVRDGKQLAVWNLK